LLQVPAAEARRAAQGMDPKHTEATLADLGVRTRHFLRHERFHGITLEILKLSQRYLIGDLVRIGSAQYDIVPFAGEVRVYRHPSTRKLSVVSLDGKAIDKNGNLTDEEPSHESWEVALEPGSPMLEMHFPENARNTVMGMLTSIREAIEFYARWKPEAEPLGVFGIGWEHSLQSALVDLLKNPEASLPGDGAFFLREDFEARYREVISESGGEVVLQGSDSQSGA
jgi:hypothetical protein